MRADKKINTLETKKTRSCVVRLEKLSHKSLSSTPSPPTTRRSLNTSQIRVLPQQHKFKNESQVLPQTSSAVDGGMGATSKQPSGANQSRGDPKNFRGPIKKRPVGSNNPQTPHQKQAANMTALKSNQKIKVIHKTNRNVTATPTPTTKSATPVREETPTPTIAAGRSRRAIKPNPKYASEDMVTPKMMRNVGGTQTSAKSSAVGDGKQRKASTSSDDFYNGNSDDEFDDLRNINSNDYEKGDKAYKVDEIDEILDSDISEIEEEVSKRTVKMKGRPMKRDLPVPQNTAAKLVNQTPNRNAKRLFNTRGSTVRTAPTQLQQLRRSLQSANAQRNQSFLAGSGSVAQKRKQPDNDSDSDDDSYTVARKQILVTTSSGLKVRLPVKENSSATSGGQPQNRHRILPGQKIIGNDGKHPLNGSNRTIGSQFIERKRILESNKSSQDTPPKTNMRTLPTRQNQSQSAAGNNKLQASNKTPGPTNKNLAAAQTVNAHQKLIVGSSNTNNNRAIRTSSPKPLLRKDGVNNTTKLLSNSLPAPPAFASTSAHQHQQKKLPSLPAAKPIDKLKSALASSVNNAAPLPFSKTANSKAMAASQINNHKAKTATESGTISEAPSATLAEDSVTVNDESPNSTMDDFETMPTFTIVNVNDIINKKGDVLITKAKGQSASKTPTVVEISESISLDDDDDGDDEAEVEAEADADADIVADVEAEDKNSAQREPTKSNKRDAHPQKVNKIPTHNTRTESEKKKSPLSRKNNNDSTRKQSTGPVNTATTASASNPPATAKPQILNHRLGLRNNARITAKTSTSVTSNPDKPAPRILNSVVAKKTQPVKPMITNLDDSAEESFPLSLDEEETEDEAESQSFEQPQLPIKYPMDFDSEDTETQSSDNDEPITKALTPKSTSISKPTTAAKSPPSPAASVQRKKRLPNTQTSPIAVTSNKKRILTPAAAKENSLAAVNQQVNDTKTSSTQLAPQTRKQPAEKVVISRQGDKIIKKITCFETWYVINMPLEPKRQALMKNQLDIPLINLANNAKSINLPSELWSCKVTLYELSATTLAKSTFITYTGDLEEYNINEEDRAKYQPSCVMFRRSIENRQQSRMPYDRAVIFKNKTFSTNIEGKNIRLLGAPSIINTERDIEILLEVVDDLTLQSDFVEYATFVQ